jgi:hypothetical protein
MNRMRLEDIVSVRGRFHRSVNLLHDWTGSADLGEYIVTPTAREFAEQVLDELDRPQGTRAWSVTGPYGSGKSALGLFLTDIVAAKTPAHPESAKLREAHTGTVAAPFLPVLAVAERQPLETTLANGFIRALEGTTLRRRKRFGELTASGSTSEMVETILQTTVSAKKAGYGGVLVVLDEMGKFLEYAADNDLDLFVLQQLAEAAARSEVPLVVVTILHTGFADYLPVADDLRRVEWQKVQGRFRDVPFHLPAEQLLMLVGHSIVKHWSEGDRQRWEDTVDAILTHDQVFEEAARRLDLRELFYACYPFHPLAALLLWPLFRSKLAQNERSLFAFLTSFEPYGFREFLQQDVGAESLRLFDVGRLYDYVSSALGIAAFRGEQARRWSLVEHALGRIGADAPEGTAMLIKAIGLLGMYGSAVGLRPSEETLRLLGGPNAEDALLYLENRSVVLFRRHAKAYGLWEGSDVDLDGAFAEAMHKAARGSIAERLRRVLPLRPLVARAHYIESGTLRLIDVSVIDGEPRALSEALATEPENDARVLFLMSGAKEDTALLDLARQQTRGGRQPLTIIAIPHGSYGLDEVLRELEAWIWVRDHVPALAGDPVARQEVIARIAAARDRFERAAGEVFGLPGYRFDPAQTKWVYGGECRTVADAKGFQRWLTEICQEQYHAAPQLRNELINRISLSSAASAARRTLVERMITSEAEECLGIEGAPPEASIYASMLQRSGIHALRGGRRMLGFPNQEEWRPAWTAIEDFFDAARGVPRPIAELYQLLARAPFGMREGPVSVLLSAVLITRQDEVALYEDQVFVPVFRVEVLERLLRRPTTFAVQSLDVSPEQKRALAELRRLIAGESGVALSESEDVGLVPVVRGLIQLIGQLPAYARRTSRLSRETLTARDVLARARDPYRLLFVDLPQTLSISLENDTAAREFAVRLFETVRDLRSAYPLLLQEIGELVRDAFQLSGNDAQVFARLRERARSVDKYVADRRLRPLINELLAENRQCDWAAIARAIKGGMPPAQWNDADLAAFRVQLQEVALDFVRLAQLAETKEKNGAQRLLRIDLLGDATGAVEPVVIPLSSELDEEVSTMANRIRELLGPNASSATNGTLRKIRLAALAEVAADVIRDR